MSTGKLGRMREFKFTTSLTKHDFRQWEISQWLERAPSRGITVTEWVAIDDEELVAFKGVTLSHTSLSVVDAHGV